ncbi:MAG: proton-conducting transporter membrane subunit [Coriobacteriia bacterium]|nr:proton-conducting transporter membrane subunit [Coriobacteriia bacterium]
MTFTQFALLTTAFMPFACAAVVFALGEARGRIRETIALCAATVTTLSAVAVGLDAASGDTPARVGIELLGIGLALRADALGAVFAVVASALWLVTTVYAIGYLSHGRDKARFFGFFALCVGSAAGIALSANLLTLFVFYEVLTLATYPLVVHSGTPKAIAGGRTYLLYALGGGVLLALGIIGLATLGGVGDFAEGGALSAELMAGRRTELIAIFVLLIAGFGVKAALFPAHGWLPAAMVAPAPVSALLHAVAVVKAGVFGIARVVLHVYGPQAAGVLGVLVPLAALAAFTMIFASVRALAFDDIKKRLAYSTIGQLSYIVLGLAIGTPVAVAAAVAHIAHHAVMKITMFFTAGVLAEELGVSRVSQMNGVGRRMPFTMVAFSLAALGIIGVAPISGFVTKWGLGSGALDAGQLWPLVVLGLSSVLNAAYLMPMIGKAWFGATEREWPEPKRAAFGVREADARMVWPLGLTALAGVAFGVAAGAPWTPSAWSAAVAGIVPTALRPWDPAAFGLDGAGVAFLVLASIGWLAAAVSTWRAPRSHPLRFRTLLTLSAFASLLLAFARDPAAFYACFGVMALSAYGLIVDDGTPRASAAGKAYLALTVVGEALLLTGLLVGAAGEGPFAYNLLVSPWFMAGTLSILASFGLKVSMLGLGGWMPGAYRAATRGSGAALAGVVSTAGVLGLVRFMPGGVIDLAEWGLALVIFGLASAFYGVVCGIFQRHARHVLAYSSVSQFGLMWVGVGAGLMKAELWPAAVAAVAVYLLHHGLAKAALFAGDDVAAAGARPRAVVVALALPALSLAGLPFTSGAVAKMALKAVAGKTPDAVAHALELLLPLAAVGTTLLMVRFLALVYLRTGSRTETETDSVPRGRSIAFGLLFAFVVGWVWLVDAEVVRSAALKSLDSHYLWALTWPVVLGTALGAVTWVLRERIPARWSLRLPPGDVWAPLLALYERRWEAYQSSLEAQEQKVPVEPAWRAVTRQRVVAVAGGLTRAEAWLLTWAIAGTALGVFGVLALLLVR